MSELTNVVPPPDWYKGGNLWTNWHGYRVERGNGFDANLLNELQSKRANIEACISIISGSGGKGKSYFALRLAEILDPKFDPDVQVVFGAEELLELISSSSPLGMGRVIICDESQFAMSNREWATGIQRVLMKQLEAIRSRGYIIFIVALSEATIDNLARNFVITHKIHLYKRGHARAYKYSLGAFSKVPYATTISKDASMALPSAEYCEGASCLICPYSGLSKTVWQQRENWEKNGDIICITNRARYERKKKAYLENEVDTATEGRRAKKEEAKVPKPTLELCIALLKEARAELALSVQDNLDRVVALNILKRKYPNIAEYMMIKSVRILSQDKAFMDSLPKRDKNAQKPNPVIQ